MGTAVSGQPLKTNHRRHASVSGTAGSPIEDPSEWAMDFATYDESFAKARELYSGANAEEKQSLNQLFMDNSGLIFTDKERMAAHFAGLNN